MTVRTITVDAQWALHGKARDDEGYRVLACSTAELSAGNFADALSRFQLGALNTLPQVSVSYARHGTEPGVSYLALAIHWFATDGQRHADGVRQFDNHGRDTAFTSYFCVPYQSLKDRAIGYLDMYEAFRAVMLPVANGPAREVEITATTPRAPAADDLALRVAPLLLTGTPVCVLGAEGTDMAERLRFIDETMTLLPYGFRSRMTAATWTRATNREHRFRLFFSSAPRAESDHVVTWGEQDLVHIPRGPASEYFDWLIDKIRPSPLSILPTLTTEWTFGPKAALQAIELVEGTRRTRRQAMIVGWGDRHEPPPAPPTPTPTDPTPPAPAPHEDDFVEVKLRDCAEHATAAGLVRLKSDIAWLKRYSEGGAIDEARRMRYRELIATHGLLRPNPQIEKHEAKLYEALLALAFRTPLNHEGYHPVLNNEGYRQVEDCLGIQPGEPPQQRLLEAIERGGMTRPVTAGIVYWHLRTTDEKKLNRWLGSGAVDVLDLIRLLSRDWHRPQHARIICDLTLYYLTTGRPRCEPLKLRDELLKHGFLAGKLQTFRPGVDQYQVDALYTLLRTAYPSGIDSDDINLILADEPASPTPALLAAVLMHLSRPEDWQLAYYAYARGSLRAMRLDQDTAPRPQARVPSFNVRAITTGTTP